MILRLSEISVFNLKRHRDQKIFRGTKCYVVRPKKKKIKLLHTENSGKMELSRHFW